MSKLFNPDYLKHLCQKYRLSPSHNYGQNFLICEDVVGEIIGAAEIKKTDLIVEVGPGFGVLTHSLAEKAKKVISFEIEKKLEPYWIEKIKNEKLENLEIIWGNVLRQSLNLSIFKSFNYKVVANLPYQITSKAIRLFLEAENKPTVAIFMVQKEVAERICAKQGKMSLLSVATQYFADVEIVAEVSRGCFWPEPKVDSAIIKLKIKKLLPKNGDKEFEKIFFKVVKAGFAQKRKLLVKNLSGFLGKEKTKEIMEKFGLSPAVRAQELSLDDWERLVNFF